MLQGRRTKSFLWGARSLARNSSAAAWGRRLERSSYCYLVQVSLLPSQLSFLYILIGTFPPPLLFSVSGQLRLWGACAVAVGRLWRRVLPLLGGARSLRAGGAREQSHGAPANQGEPIELGRHEQSGAEVTVPGHRQGHQVEGNRRVPGWVFFLSRPMECWAPPLTERPGNNLPSLVAKTRDKQRLILFWECNYSFVPEQYNNIYIFNQWMSS